MFTQWQTSERALFQLTEQDPLTSSVSWWHTLMRAQKRNVQKHNELQLKQKLNRTRHVDWRTQRKKNLITNDTLRNTEWRRVFSLSLVSLVPRCGFSVWACSEQTARSCGPSGSVVLCLQQQQRAILVPGRTASDEDEEEEEEKG